MAEFEQRIKELSESLEKEDIAFILEARNAVVESYDVRERIDRALSCLYRHKLFRNMVFEVYLKENGNTKCASIEGVDKDVKEKYIDRFIDPQTERDGFIQAAGIGHVPFFTIDLNDFGVLIVSSKGGEISDYQKTLLTHYVRNNLTFSIKHATDYKTNFEKAMRNSLTGLYNRGFFEDALEREIKIQKRGNRKGLSLILFDIDHFKEYNDSNGHLRGDEAIKVIAKILTEYSRETDTPARYGGEEFALLLPDTILSDGERKGENIRSIVEMYNFSGEHTQPEGRLTISGGLAHMPTHTIDGENLVEFADMALYHSKRSGRNRITVYSQNLFQK